MVAPVGHTVTKPVKFGSVTVTFSTTAVAPGGTPAWLATWTSRDSAGPNGALAVFRPGAGVEETLRVGTDHVATAGTEVADHVGHQVDGAVAVAVA